jgi:hypothetical protein
LGCEGLKVGFRVSPAALFLNRVPLAHLHLQSLISLRDKSAVRVFRLYQADALSLPIGSGRCSQHIDHSPRGPNLDLGLKPEVEGEPHAIYKSCAAGKYPFVRSTNVPPRPHVSKAQC